MKGTQLAIIDGSALAERDVMQAMEQVIVELHQSSDISRAAHVLEVVEKLENVSGHAKAKLLYGMKNWWDETDQSDKRGVEFSDYIEGSNILKKTAIDRYLVVQEHIENLNIPKEFHSRPIRELVPIAKALQQGYDISKAVWAKLKIANGQGDVGRIIREEVKQKPARKNAMQFVLERDGTLNAYKSNKRIYVGYLDVTNTDELVQMAISRLLSGVGAKTK